MSGAAKLPTMEGKGPSCREAIIWWAKVMAVLLVAFLIYMLILSNFRAAR
jgi:hypothetical protein